MLEITFNALAPTVRQKATAIIAYNKHELFSKYSRQGLNDILSQLLMEREGEVEGESREEEREGEERRGREEERDYFTMLLAQGNCKYKAVIQLVFV